MMNSIIARCMGILGLITMIAWGFTEAGGILDKEELLYKISIASLLCGIYLLVVNNDNT